MIWNTAIQLPYSSPQGVRKRKKILLCFPCGLNGHAIWIYPVVLCIVAPLVCTSIFLFCICSHREKNSHDVYIITHNYNYIYCNDMTFSQKAGYVRFLGFFSLFCHIWSEKEAEVKLEVTNSLLCTSNESFS